MPDIYNITIKQGATYHLVIKYPSDITSWQPRGMIRKNYADKNGELLAEFEFDTLTYDVDANETTIPISISATITETIPVPGKIKKSKDDYIPGQNCWVYDIEFENSGEVIAPLYGFVLVNYEVTRE